MADSPHREGIAEVVPSEGNGTGPYPELREDVQNVRLYVALQKLWRARRRMALVMLLFVASAVVYILGSRNEFTTTATLMPEQQSESTSIAGLDMLEDFGGLLGGLSPGNLLQKQNALPVQIYPEILKSTFILTELLRGEIQVDGRRMTLDTYLNEGAPFSLWESARRGFAQMTSWNRPDGTPVVMMDSSIVYLTRDEMRTVEDLRKRVSADYDKKTGVLSVSAKMPDPHVAAAVGSAAVGALTDYITRYRLHKLEQDLAFMSGRYEDAKTRFNSALDDVAVFQDRNQNLARNLARTEGQRLQAEYDLAFSVYSSLATKLEEAKIKVQEETPVFQVLQPITVPLKKSEPRTLLILFLSLLGGLIVGSALVLSGISVDRIRHTLRSAE